MIYISAAHLSCFVCTWNFLILQVTQPYNMHKYMLQNLQETFIPELTNLLYCDIQTVHIFPKVIYNEVHCSPKVLVLCENPYIAQ
jgi:hypothetical protein